MCGIVYSKSFNGKPVNRTVAKRYQEQRHRGSNGFGFYVPETNRLTHNPRENRAMALLRRTKKATEILFHHRLPTSTANVRNGCHPYSTKNHFDNNYVVVHNGVLYNERDLKETHYSQGIKYVSDMGDGSFNDSEALAYDIASYIEGRVDKISAGGSIAFIAIQRDKKGKQKAVYFGRNSGNPLVMKLTAKSFTLSSEGVGTLIDPDHLYRFDYKTGDLTREKCIFPSYRASTYGNYGGYNNGYEWYDDDFSYRPESDPNRMYLDYDGRWRTKTPLDDREMRDRSLIKNLKEQLEYDGQYDPKDSIEMGEDQLEMIRNRMDRLKVKMDLDVADDAEQDEYFSLEAERHYLTQAVNQLKLEVAGQAQLGFHYTPDSSPKQLPEQSTYPYR